MSRVSALSAARASVATTLLVLALGLVGWRLSPPPALPIDAAATAFSATRAIALLARLAPAEQPRPLGSPAHRQFRERLQQELLATGLTPEPSTHFVCSRFGTCGQVTNVLARLPGPSPKVILLMAHYDSVPAGPGAADDGVGVASLVELGRAIRAGAALDHSLWLLFTDGEEMGLLGARAFARSIAGTVRITAAINLDARGTEGPSHVFRMGPNTARLLDALRLPRPVVSSAHREVFRHLPNETDLSELLAVGITGFDLAFFGGAARYHTPLDDRAHLDPRSVQHQGDNALALLRTVDARPPREEPGEAIYFDLFAGRVVGWSVGLNRWLALATLLTQLCLTGALCRRRRLDPRAVIAGLVVWPAALAAGLSLGLAAELTLNGAGALPSPWVAHPMPVLLAAAALAGSVFFGAAALLPSPRGPTLWSAHALWTAGLGWLTASLAPGLSHLFVVPAVAGALGGLVWAIAPDQAARIAARIAWSLPALATTILVGPILLGLYPALGLVHLAPYVGVVLWLLFGAGPELSELPSGAARWGALALGLASLASLLASTLVPSSSAQVPRRTSLGYLSGPGPSARFVADRSWGPLDPALSLARGFVAEPEPTPWLGSFLAAATTPAPRLPLLAPTLNRLHRRHQDGRTRARAHVTSPRGAQSIALVLPHEAGATVRLDGEPCPGRRHRSGVHFVHLTVPAAGFELEVDFEGSGPLAGLLVDSSPGLPPIAEALRLQRDEQAVTSHLGDATMVASAVVF